MQEACHLVDERLLQTYLERSLPKVQYEWIKSHLDDCDHCWARWNRYRWERAKGTQGYAELQAYLGDDFQEYFDSSRALREEWSQRNPQTKAQIEQFFTETTSYLYNLVIWQESGHRPPYVSWAEPFLQHYQSHTICDFGCGVGNDGLHLLAQGYEVVFCEFDNASSRFLRWRLRRRHINARWVDPCDIASIRADTLWVLDVIDHLPDPQATLHPLLATCQTLIYENDHACKKHGIQSFHLDHDERALHAIFLSYGFQRDASATQLNVWHKVHHTNIP